MKANYTPGTLKVSMNTNSINVEKSQSIQQQIDAFFAKGGKINEIPLADRTKMNVHQQFTMGPARDKTCS